MGVDYRGELLSTLPEEFQESGNLLRQKERLIQYCNAKYYNVVTIYEEVASGLNDHRRELTKLFRNLSDVDVIVVEYEDRLARFGYSYLKEFAASFNVEIEAVEKVSKQQPNEEMVNDLVSIVTCFSDCSNIENVGIGAR